MKCRRVGRISSVPLDEKNDEERKDFGRKKKRSLNAHIHARLSF